MHVYLLLRTRIILLTTNRIIPVAKIIITKIIIIINTIMAEEGLDNAVR